MAERTTRRKQGRDRDEQIYEEGQQQRALTDARAPEMVTAESYADGEQTEMVDGVVVKLRGNRATVDFAPGMRKGGREPESDEFVANLAEEISGAEESELIADVVDKVQADLESRRDWQRRIDQAMELLGLRDTPLKDLPFEGASSVTYPLIAEACVQFQARAIEEVFPSEGPCKTKIVGERTTEKEEQADRVQHHMNYQMTEQDRAYFWHVDQMLFWLPVAGSAFKKTYYDPISDMVVSRLVFPGDFIVPYIATDLRTAPRYTHRVYRTDGELKRLIQSGFYKEVELSEPANSMNDTDSQDRSREMMDEADDRQQSMHEKDFVYEILEMHCDLELEDDQEKYFPDGEGYPLPYIITVNKTDETLLGIRRNWRENDELFEKRLWFTHYKYLPGLGFYGFGLLHLIGSVAESSTGTIRALLDSAAFANLQGGFVSDEVKLPPGDHTINPGVWKQVKVSAEELQRAFYTPPFKEPSPALANLFKELVEAGRRFASITEEMVGDAPNTGPVGTTIALIEQGSKVFSGVHRRLHTAQAEEFSLRAELNFEFLDEEYPYEIEGQDMMVMKADYDGRVDVIPVSDPNIFSSTQRIAQAQAMIDLAERFPGEFNLSKAIERFLKAIKVPDYEELLTGKTSQARRDPIQENMSMLTGGGAKAFVAQDHQAHITVHMNFLMGLNEDALAIVGPMMQSHIAEHYALKYYADMNQQFMAQTGEMLPLPTWMDGEGTDEEDEIPVEAEIVISQIAAQMPPMQIMPQQEDDAADPDKEDEHQQEMRHKQEVFQLEQQQKDEAFAREQERLDGKADADANRSLTSTMTDESRKEEQHTQQLRREDEKAAGTRRQERRTDREKRLRKDRGQGGNSGD